MSQLQVLTQTRKLTILRLVRLVSTNTDHPGGSMQNWQLQTAKAQFSELVRKAITYGPQKITVHGREKVVLISIEEYEKLSEPKGSFVAFMKSSPLAGLNINIERDKSRVRDINL